MYLPLENIRWCDTGSDTVCCLNCSFLLNSNSPRFTLETEEKEGGGRGRQGAAEDERRGGGREMDAETEGQTERPLDGAERKLAVLNMAFRYLDTYRELLQEEGERSNSFPKVTHPHTQSARHNCNTQNITIISRCTVWFLSGLCSRYSDDSLCSIE